MNLHSDPRSDSDVHTRVRPAESRAASRASRRPSSPGSAPLSWPTIGHKLGKYRLCLQIGSGGMATVYLARREDEGASEYGGNYVALKCIRSHLSARPAFATMFADEARVASRIRHANVCSVLDHGCDHGQLYLAMEYLDGETLKSIHRQIPRLAEELSPTRLACVTARIIADAAEGLHAVHELCDASGRPLHAVHRDVSPENLLLTYEGNLKVLDFGLVHAAGRATETQTGIVKGKFAYIAPEVLESKPPDRRTDVWSLGVVLWELLTGERLFQADTDPAILQAVMNRPIVPPSTVSACPAELDAVVLGALDRDPEQRYPDARAFGRDLTRVIAELGEAVGLAELADFMTEAFPSGRDCHRQLMRVAEQVEEASVALELNRGFGSGPGAATRELPGPGDDEDSLVDVPVELLPPLRSLFARIKGYARSLPGLAIAALLLTGAGAFGLGLLSEGGSFSFASAAEPTPAPSKSTPARVIAAPSSCDEAMLAGRYALEVVEATRSDEDELALRVRLVPRPGPPTSD